MLKYLAIFVLFLGTTPAWAEAEIAGETPGPEAPQAPDAQAFGLLELRPSYNLTGGGGYTDNTARVGWQFSEVLKVDYTQFFSTSLGGAPFSLGGEGSYVRLQREGIWSSGDGTKFLALEGRVNLPTSPTLRRASFLAGLRTDMRLDLALAPGLWLTLREAPSVAFYERNGYFEEDADGSFYDVANPWLANLTAMELYWEVTPRLALFVPLGLTLTKHRSFRADAESNGAWSGFLNTWPEITYRVTPNAYVGLSYRTENWLTADLSGLQIGEAFAQGAAQAVFGASF